jgi:hypothetical protein
MQRVRDVPGKEPCRVGDGLGRGAGVRRACLTLSALTNGVVVL